MDQLQKAIGEKVKQARKERRWTQEMLAEKADTTPQYISRIERGKTGLSLEFLYKLAGIMECPVYALLPASGQSRRSFFSQELEYQLMNCSPWKKQHILNYVTWFLQQPDPGQPGEG
ncbi:MAG TPA: helix-turn-helix domain-containing protein [Candidatus Fournierella excrementigallinarum]|nr:helix-turn-helix domain-containing protein [Candidatus Fournierella merdigallinarum]HJB67372.1 helix-turn-helix domain-containing protein [Candidatus Fournierella excrementigallinarum]